MSPPSRCSKLSFAHLFSGKSHEPGIALAEKLKEIAPFPVGKVFFANSGSEANDTQIKLFWYANNARGLPQKKKIISRVKAYHGVTMVAASLTGLPANHKSWDLPFDFVKFADCPHYYRAAQRGESEEQFSRRMADDLQALIEREGPETIAAMIAEPVQGAGGVILPPKGYFRGDRPRAREIRHSADRRRSDHRLRPHRQLVRLRNLRFPAGKHDGGQSAVAARTCRSPR